MGTHKKSEGRRGEEQSRAAEEEKASVTRALLGMGLGWERRVVRVEYLHCCIELEQRAQTIAPL
jgi:hypothetical protein